MHLRVCAAPAPAGGPAGVDDSAAVRGEAGYRHPVVLVRVSDPQRPLCERHVWQGHLMGDRVVRSAAVAHVLLVVAFLVAVAAGGELRLLLALVGGVVASLGWLAWLRNAALTEDEATMPVRPVARLPAGSPPPAARTG